MSYIDPLDDLPPPPAYSAEELDRKISATVQLSLSTPQPQPSLDEEWEVWDEAAFEAAARAIAVGGSSSGGQAGSSTHPVEPLKIKKKGPEPYTSSKPRPSWLSQAESAPQDTQTSQHGAPSNTTPMPMAIHQLPEDDEDEDLPSHPPPAFTPSGPSLDGPPYEQVMSPPWVADGSSMGSPLNSPTIPAQQLVYPEPPDDISAQIRPPQAGMRHRSPQPQVIMQNRMSQPQGDMHLRTPQGDMHHQIPRHSLPAPQRTPQWPVSEYSTPRPSHMPISTFDPSVAYNQESNYGLSPAPMVSPQAPAADYSYNNATAFYNAAVASHLKTRPSQNNHSQHMHSSQYYPASHQPTQRHDSGAYGHGSLTPVRNPAAARFSQYSQYPGSHMTPHLPR